MKVKLVGTVGWWTQTTGNTMAGMSRKSERKLP